jgi:hypothetical protein
MMMSHREIDYVALDGKFLELADDAHDQYAPGGAGVELGASMPADSPV